MKKGIIAVIIVILVAIVGVLGYFVYNNYKENDGDSKSSKSSQKEDENSVEKIAKELGVALESKDKLEEFVEDNLALDIYQVTSKVASKLSFTRFESIKEYQEGFTEDFEKAMKDFDEEDFDKEDAMDEAMGEYKSYYGEKLTVKEVGEKKQCKVFPMFDRIDIEYENEDGDEYEYALYMYEGKLVSFYQTKDIEGLEKILDQAYED